MDNIPLWVQVLGYIVMIAVTMGFVLEDPDDDEDMFKSLLLATIWPIIFPLVVVLTIAQSVFNLRRKICKKND